jgi:RNA polymerase sigma-70 factor, ECF subfamily
MENLASDAMNQETGAEESAVSPDHPVVVEALKHYETVRRFLASKFHNLMPEEIEDAMQDAYLQLSRKAHTFRGQSEVSSWVTRIAFNTALAILQKRVRRSRYEQLTPLDVAELEEMQAAQARPEQEMPDAELIRDESTQVVQEAIASLKEEFREVVVADHEGLSSKEIAERVGATVAAVKSRLHRARQELQEKLVSYELLS